jgi:uncharacterized protein DUF7002
MRAFGTLVPPIRRGYMAGRPRRPGSGLTPEDLAARHPRLYHVADPAALPGILRHGLLPTSALLSLFEVPEADRPAIERRRRPAGVALSHPVHGRAVITDNLPLSEAALEACLDDGLAPADWLGILNGRVFFWPDEESLGRLLGARLNRRRERLVLVLDTLSLARRHQRRVELAAINTGSTIRRPARRGLSTFTPLLRHDYLTWRRLRGGLDRIREVTVVGGVADVADHLVEHRSVGGRAAWQRGVRG